MRKLYFLIISCLTIILSGQQIFAQIDSGKIGMSNWGKEFWFSVPPCYEDESYGFANFIKFFVTAPYKTLVTVEVSGTGYFKARNTIPNDVIEYNITPSQATPYTKNGQAKTPSDAVYSKKAIHIYSNDPIVVYCIVRYHWSSDGWLCLPISSCGKEYIVSAAQVEPMFNSWGYKMPANVTISAGFDDTRVSFTLGGNSSTITTGGLKPGDSTKKTLMKGDVFVVSTEVSDGDLSGSKITSNKPIGVVSGNFCSDIPTGNQWCDYTAEMELPTYSWSNYYHVPKVPNRKFASLIKIISKEPNTKVYRNGTLIGTLTKSGGVVGKGFLYIRMTSDNKPGSVVIFGDKPIAVTLYNCGVQEDGYPAPNSDPFVMSILPDEQFMNEVTFCTPGIMGGQNFQQNNINLIYETDSNKLMPKDVEFAGPNHGGVFTWTTCNTKFAGADELFTNDVSGKKYAVKTISLPGDGVYKIRSKTPFTAYSFGYSDYDSYGYPAGVGLINQVVTDTLPPIPTWTKSCEGSVLDGLITDMPEDSSVRSNLSIVVFHTDFSYNYNFKYVDFIPGDTRTTTWTLNVIDQTQDARAIITFMDRRGNDTTIQIEYNAPKISINPYNFDFGKNKPGDTLTKDFWVVNSSKTDSFNLLTLKLKNGTFGFNLNSFKKLPYSIPPSDSLKFSVTFSKNTEGKYEDSIGVGNECFTFNLSRVLSNVGQPIIFVTDVTFDNLMAGLTKTVNFMVTNEGNVPLNIISFTGPTYSEYTTDLPTIDNFNPLKLNPKETKTFNIRFKPTIEGKFPDIITFTSDAGTNRKNYCSIDGSSTPNDVTDENSNNHFQFKLFPIPSTGIVNMTTSLELPAKAEIRITDLGGRLLKSFSTGLDKENELDFSNFSDGVYFIKIMLNPNYPYST